MTSRSLFETVSTAAMSVRLDEMWWGERFAAAKAIQKYPGCFVHFSNINKLGVNPSKQHRDPPGVYFYPGQWLFSDDASLSQFATEYTYYFIVKINFDASFINLGTITSAKVKQIATRNGWAEDLQRLMADPSLLSKGSTAQHNPKLLKKAGGFFYAAMDYLVNVEKKYRWLQLLRGVSGLYDPRFGIIAAGEEAQAVVFKASCIQVLETGLNKDDMDRTLATAFKAVAEKVGGTFSYKRKIPTITVQQGGKNVEVGYDWGNWNWVSTYNKDGFMAVDTDRDHSGSTGGADSYASTMEFRVTQALKKSDGQPVKHGPWDGVACTRLKDLIGRVGRTFRNVKDGQYRIFAAERTFGGSFDRSLEITTSDAQTVHVVAKIEGDNDRVGEWEASFDQTFDSRATPEQVARAVLTKLWAETKPNLAPGAPIQKISDVLAMNFTTVAQDEPAAEPIRSIAA